MEVLKKQNHKIPGAMKFLHNLDQNLKIHVKPQRNVYSLPRHKGLCNDLFGHNLLSYHKYFILL